MIEPFVQQEIKIWWQNNWR